VAGSIRGATAVKLFAVYRPLWTGRVYLPSKTTPDGITLPISIRDDLDTLTALLTDIEPGLVIFDPIKDFLGDGVNTDRENEVRPVLTPLLKLTEECGTAVIGLHHLNKSLKGDFLTRLTGSGAFKNVSRSVIGWPKTSAPLRNAPF
jgi:hypothetical protein